jgi:hypothetical protein
VEDRAANRKAVTDRPSSYVVCRVGRVTGAEPELDQHTIGVDGGPNRPDRSQRVQVDERLMRELEQPSKAKRKQRR